MLTRPPPPPWRSQPPFALADVEVRPASNELVVAGTPVRVKPRMMDVLLRLAAADGETVGRQALLDEVWPRRIVNDEVLSRVIADLRVALRDDARDAKFIETIPKVGYRLVAPVARLPVAGRVAWKCVATRRPGCRCARGGIRASSSGRRVR